MRRSLLFSLSILALTAWSCVGDSSSPSTDASGVATDSSSEIKNNALEGTWKLLARKWDTDTKQFADNVNYKIYTQNRFATIYFDPESNATTLAGGGTYSLDGDQLTETIEYFNFDSTLVGTRQTFTIEPIGESLYRQRGALSSSGTANDRPIEEFYERVEPSIHSGDAHPLKGVWNIEEATYGEDHSDADDLKKRYGKVIKIITPGYFYSAFFDPSRKYFNGVAFGTYRVDSDQYIETIESYSWDASIVGKEQIFTWEVKDGQFYQRGKINSDEYKDYQIEERSSRIE